MTDLLEPPTTRPVSLTRARASAPTAQPGPMPSPMLAETALSDLPPPTPDAPATGQGNKRLLLLVELLAIAALVVAAVMAMMWSNALGERDDAIAERDATLIELDTANNATDQAIAERDTAEADFALATAEISRLETKIAENEAELESVDAQVVELTSQLDELQTANDALVVSVEELRTLLESPVAEAPFDPAAQPAFTRYVGEVLSSRTGGTQLNGDQLNCFGGSVLTAVGLDGFGAGFGDAATDATNNALVTAMKAAAASCGIDEALIFG